MTARLDLLASDLAVVTRALRCGPLDAAVPDCPGWTLRDLGVHLGGVHRWAMSRIGVKSERHEPDDGQLADWFADGGARLLGRLRVADPATACMGFEGPATIAFWIRRMPLEAAVHRVDAERALGTLAAPVPADVAADGIAEVFDTFLPRQIALGRLPGLPYGLVVDTPEGHWQVDGPDPVAVRGGSSDVLLALWGRAADVEVSDVQRFRTVREGHLTP